MNIFILKRNWIIQSISNSHFFDLAFDWMLTLLSTWSHRSMPAKKIKLMRRRRKKKYGLSDFAAADKNKNILPPPPKYFDRRMALFSTIQFKNFKGGKGHGELSFAWLEVTGSGFVTFRITFPKSSKNYSHLKQTSWRYRNWTDSSNFLRNFSNQPVNCCFDGFNGNTEQYRNERTD